MSLLRLLPRASFLHRQPTHIRTFLTTRSLLSQQDASQPSTILSTLQPDLKTAMRAKDKPRLSTIRSLLAEITNASKTASPVDSDATFFLLLQRQIKSSKSAIAEFENAKREDLVEKEKVQLDVLDEYVSRIDVVGEEECEKVVNEVVQAERANEKWGKLDVKAKAGTVMGRSRAKIGGRPVDGAVLRGVIERIVGEQS